jgi:hypothetical protein
MPKGVSEGLHAFLIREGKCRRYIFSTSIAGTCEIIGPAWCFSAC